MKLNAELTKIVNSADLKGRFNALGIEPVSGTPEAFSAYIRTEVVKWSNVVKASGAELE